MVVNNLDIIKKLIDAKENEFYMLQIIHRSKDGATQFDQDGKKFSNKTIKSYFISSPEYLEYKMKEIMALCELFNARAYINLNKKSKKQVALKSIETLAHNVAMEDYSGIMSVLESSCGQTGACDKNKTWIVDVDTKDNMEVADVVKAIDQCEPFDTQKIVAVIPTVHGYHLISHPFNKKKFRELYTKNIDVHDNNPTLLYFKTLD